jgi:hypothetical protein
MLNKDVFKQKIKDLIDFYPSWGIKADDKSIVAKWYSKFSNLSDDEFVEIVNIHIDKIKYVPTVASLNEFREEVKKTKGDKSPEYVKAKYKYNQMVVKLKSEGGITKESLIKTLEEGSLEDVSWLDFKTSPVRCLLFSIIYILFL